MECAVASKGDGTLPDRQSDHPGEAAATHISELEAAYGTLDEVFEDGKFFPFFRSEAGLLRELERFIRGLAAEPAQPPDQSKDLTKAILALTRLPRATPNVDVELSITLLHEKSFEYCEVSINECTFSISAGVTQLEKNPDTESSVKTLFDLHSTGYREGALEPRGFDAWLAAARELIQKGALITVETFCNESVTEEDFEFETDAWDELEDRLSRYRPDPGSLQFDR